ncbi:MULTISPECIES: hypothetical protein [unclassified Ruegeria]|uniref:hypothetical protein n=1 Tax=unclassified Ruegeria TaxID=2625375 RepID=UPI001487A089|nr:MULTISPECIES: hypothetical protein [unclassified Ruegeria]NOD48389.1 hypothetical protein [Ruegeria sp. HKCCD5849]NOD52409.1 hypothetical protein [Ruegeria sp. HKCCD5851]NOE34681.1 hypothetical protein [Ruegeria sp. HKCCD7318]
MKKMLLLLCVLVAGCDAVRSTTDRVFGRDDAPAQTVTETESTTSVSEEVLEPEPVSARPTWAGAKTSIAGLGDPTTPGRWMQTPLVKSEVTARVVVPRTGAQAYITLVPIPGPASGGSRLSLDAMRALLVPLDELVEVEVYAN